MSKPSPVRYNTFVDSAIDQYVNPTVESTPEKEPTQAATKGFTIPEPVDTTPLNPKYKPVDASIGRIRHILLSLYANNDPITRNEYNKLYTDLVLKLLRPYQMESSDEDKLIISTIVQNDRGKAGEEEPAVYLRRVLGSVLILAQIEQKKEQMKMPVNFKIVSITMDGLDHWIQDHFLV